MTTIETFQERCIGAGNCAEVAPKYFDLDDAGLVVPLHTEVDAGDDDLAQPETYQLLLGYLDNDLLAIRGLAYWHLKRLVPAGEKIGYDPLASKDKRDAAIAEWKKLVPPGTVPKRD